MDAIRDLVNETGLQPEHFDTMIFAVIFVGGIWAAVRLYRDLTRETIEPVNPITINLRRQTEDDDA